MMVFFLYQGAVLYIQGGLINCGLLVAGSPPPPPLPLGAEWGKISKIR
jgi:hypothetical protein